ncbi:MAG: aminotransferase class V-fold PLP-dependent enzyme [Acidobacteria bacterium]|nr:aminotransferase class V-fold PLP-dependent enzyme [Acidobacteriota bacterium]MCA1611637.1 aminotransferase class V-fold PLP-dependent enzyme [Acidobacteriota bacterium]
MTPTAATEGFDLERLRNDTPGCRTRIHLNNAGAGLMPRPVVEAMKAHLDLEAEIGGYEAAAEKKGAVGEFYVQMAKLIGTTVRNIAFAGSATAAYAQALSSIPFERGDQILTTRDDYISNQIAFLSLRKRFGVEVVRAPALAAGGVDVEGLIRSLDRRRPRLVAVTHIPTNSGLVQPVEEIGRACRERDLLYLVDACQSVGQLVIDVEKIGCDFLSATCRKFLRGPRGSGFLYVSDRILAGNLEPLFLDMRGAEWTSADTYAPSPTATRFEDWEFPYAIVLGCAEAARYATIVGMDRVAARSPELGRRLRSRLAAIPGVRVLDWGRQLCAIVTAAIPGWEATPFQAELNRRRINAAISLRNYAVLDFEEKDVEWAIRFSPHYYNTDEEIEAAAMAVEEILAARRR